MEFQWISHQVPKIDSSWWIHPFFVAQKENPNQALGEQKESEPPSLLIENNMGQAEQLLKPRRVQ